MPTGRRVVARGFTVDDAMVAEFREQLEADKVRMDAALFAKDLDFIKAMIRYRIEEAVFGFAEAQKHLIAVDPQAQLGISMFPEAQALLVADRTPAKVAQK